MLHPLKITSTLADETRFSIYEYILKSKEDFSVTQIAEHFNIHPNVARLHLTKLAEINVIIADYNKTGKGGRPGRVYRAADEAITLSFPKKDFSQLFKWAYEIINELGQAAIDVGKKITYKDGFTTMKQMMESKKTITTNQKLNLLQEVSSLIGYVPITKQRNGILSIQFTIFNCPYDQFMQMNKEIICELHEAYLRGQVDALFEENEFIQFEKK